MENVNGSILGKNTLKELIDSKKLILKDERGRCYRYLSLVENQRIDETSITVNIGRLFRFSADISELSIIGKYDIESNYELVDIKGGEFIIEPNDYLIGISCESFTIPNDVVGFISERRTSAGNLGLEIKGFIPPGLVSEQVRFTIRNSGRIPVRMYIGQFPPMKVIFHTLTSEESYRADRKARVNQDTTISSGLGENTDINLVKLTSLDIYSKRRGGKECEINFSIENGEEILKHITLFPNLCKKTFSITSCSEGWELNYENSEEEKNQKHIAKSISYHSKLQKKGSISGMLTIVFSKKPDNQPIFFVLECLNNKMQKVTVKYPQFPFLITNNGFNISWKKICERAITVFFTSIVVLVFQKYGSTIKELIVEWVNIMFDIVV